MPANLEQTRAKLQRHHRDGEHFADLMTRSFADRFDADFWAHWADHMEEILPAEPVVVDLGSATGLFLQSIVERYPGARAVGVECAPWMLDAMAPLPEGAEVVCQDLHDPRLPLEDATVDAVMASVVLHEMTQPVRALQEAARLLKPGGRLFILDWVRAPLADYVASQSGEATVFGAETATETLDDLFEHFAEHNRFSREDLAYMLARCGFDVVDSQPLRGGRFARLVASRRAA